MVQSPHPADVGTEAQGQEGSCPRCPFNSWQRQPCRSELQLAVQCSSEYLLSFNLCIADKGGFPGGSAGKESACCAGDPGSIPGLGRSPGEGIGYPLQCSWASLVAQLVKNLPAMRETWVRSLGWEDTLEKEKLPFPVFWPREFHGLCSPWDHQELDITEQLSL